VSSFGEQNSDLALEAATLALTGRQRREASRFASIELRAADPDYGPWRALAYVLSALVALICIIALWLL
jgi:hypothetical protein